MTDRQKKIVAIFAFIIFLAFCGAVAWLIGRPMFALIEKPEEFRAWVDSYGIFGNIIFVGMTVLQVVVALIPGEALEIGAGYAFGAIEGTILCLLGTMLGSILVFLLVRRFGVKLVEVFFPVEKIRNLKLLKDRKRLNIITFFAFFLPGTPKDLLTYAVGLTEMPLGTFLILTSVARLPSIVTSTVTGNALEKENYLFAVITFAGTLVISLAGLMIYNKHYTGTDNDAGEKGKENAKGS